MFFLIRCVHRHRHMLDATLLLPLRLRAIDAAASAFAA